MANQSPEISDDDVFKRVYQLWCDNPHLRIAWGITPRKDAFLAKTRKTNGRILVEFLSMETRLANCEQYFCELQEVPLGSLSDHSKGFLFSRGDFYAGVERVVEVKWGQVLKSQCTKLERDTLLTAFKKLHYETKQKVIKKGGVWAKHDFSDLGLSPAEWSGCYVTGKGANDAMFDRVASAANNVVSTILGAPAPQATQSPPDVLAALERLLGELGQKHPSTLSALCRNNDVPADYAALGLSRAQWASCICTGKDTVLRTLIRIEETVRASVLMGRPVVSRECCSWIDVLHHSTVRAMCITGVFTSKALRCKLVLPVDAHELPAVKGVEISKLERIHQIRCAVAKKAQKENAEHLERNMSHIRMIGSRVTSALMDEIDFASKRAVPKTYACVFHPKCRGKRYSWADLQKHVADVHNAEGGALQLAFDIDSHESQTMQNALLRSSALDRLMCQLNFSSGAPLYCPCCFTTSTSKEELLQHIIEHNFATEDSSRSHNAVRAVDALCCYHAARVSYHDSSEFLYVTQPSGYSHSANRDWLNSNRLDGEPLMCPECGACAESLTAHIDKFHKTAGQLTDAQLGRFFSTLDGRFYRYNPVVEASFPVAPKGTTSVPASAVHGSLGAAPGSAAATPTLPVGPAATAHEKNNATIVVGVIDTPINLEHPLLRNLFEIPAQGYPQFQEGNPILSTHGTYVSGILCRAAGLLVDGPGTWALAQPPPNIRLRAYAAFETDSTTERDIAKCIENAVTDLCHLINFSIAYEPCRNTLVTQRMNAAIVAGCVVVVAAGNGNCGAPPPDRVGSKILKRLVPPAGMDGVITVCAHSPCDTNKHWGGCRAAAFTRDCICVAASC